MHELEDNINNIRELKQIIKKEVLKDFSCNEFLVEIGSMIIIAKTICSEKEVKYEFVLDTQFLSTKEITYEEVVMIKNVIDILNKYKKLAISRLRKWTVEEYLNYKKIREEKSEKMLEALKKALSK